MSLLRCLAASIMLFISLTAGVAQAQQQTEPTEPLRVGYYLSPPFVMETDGELSGMAVELWEALAAHLGLEGVYEEYETIRALVDAAAAGRIDVALTNLTITEDRAERIDFTHPWFDAGLRIMVAEDQSAGFWDVMAGLEAAGHLRAYAWLAFVIVVATVLVTLFDRHFDKDFPRGWRDGIAEGFYTVMSVATSGRTPSRKNLFGWIGRIWQGIWLVCGIGVLAYVTSSVTSVMTTLSVTNHISTVADLLGRTVGVFTGSVAERYAVESGLGRRSFAHVENAVQALNEGRIAAIIGDAPVLEYYTHTHDEPVSVVGAIFEPDKYGFGLQLNSDLTRPLTVAIIGAHERGLIEELKVRHFGESP